MRDKPKRLLVPWGKSDKRFWPSQNLYIKKNHSRAEKNRRGSAPFETPRGDGIPLDPQEKRKAPQERGLKNGKQ
jgi:hypothetical protein